MSDDAKAWGDFWAKNSGGDANGCLPERWAAIEDAQREAWLDFIANLPNGAHILDLATGDGRVLRWMHEGRSGLILQGIDLAPELPTAPEGTTTRGGVAMEELPFEDDCFDAVVSQFGFEYGDVAKVAAEISRVLKPQGRVGLMVHRGDGPILEHNKARMDAIHWALEEKNVGGTVIRALNTPGAGVPVAAQVAAAFAKLGAANFGASSPAWEIPEAIRRACQMGPGGDMQPILDTIGAITAQAENEMGRISSLARACATADDRAGLVGAFEAHGHTLSASDAVAEPSGRALADFLSFG